MRLARRLLIKVKDVVHELWLVSDNECRCELLKILKELGITKNGLGMQYVHHRDI